jgi:hypothetical protein
MLDIDMESADVDVHPSRKRDLGQDQIVVLDSDGSWIMGSK